MAGGAYLPPEVGHNSLREGEHFGGTLRYGRNGNVYGAAGVMSADIPGLAPPPEVTQVRPYLPTTGSGSTIYGMTAMEDTSIMAQDRRGMGFDTAIGSGSILSPLGGRQDFSARREPPTVQTGGPGLGLPPMDSSATLYVEGIPADCKRREAAHIFRPFIGFKEVRLVYKEAKRPGGDQFVICFVDFADARCAATALEALQGYKLDENDHASPALKLQFARVPGPRGGAYRDNSGGRHDSFFSRGQ